MASTSAPPGSWRQGGERRAAHGPPIGDGLLTLRHRRQRTTTGHTPCAAGRHRQAHHTHHHHGHGGTGRHHHRAHPCGAPTTTTTTAVHGSRAAGTAKGAGRQAARQPRHAMYLPCCCPRTCQSTGHPTTSPSVLHSQEWSATVTPLNLTIRLVFGRDGARDSTQQPPLLPPLRFTTAGTCQERAKTQVGVHKGGVSWITLHRCCSPPSVRTARPRHGSAGATTVAIRVGALRARGRRAPRRPSPRSAHHAAAPERKACRSCHEVKPIADYAVDRSRRTGHAGICKACDCTRSSARYYRNTPGAVSRHERKRIGTARPRQRSSAVRSLGR